MRVYEALVIEPQCGQDGRMKIGNADPVGDSLITEFIGRAMNVAAFDSATRQKKSERVAIVVASIVVLGDRQPAKLTGPHYESLVQQASRFEILHERR